jgi:hypothetical protein
MKTSGSIPFEIELDVPTSERERMNSEIGSKDDKRIAPEFSILRSATPSD